MAEVARCQIGETTIIVYDDAYKDKTPEEIMAEPVIPEPAPVVETPAAGTQAGEETVRSLINDDFKIPPFLTSK